MGAVLLAVGVGLIYLPAGVVVAGIALVVAGYVARYMEANT